MDVAPCHAYYRDMGDDDLTAEEKARREEIRRLIADLRRELARIMARARKRKERAKP